MTPSLASARLPLMVPRWTWADRQRMKLVEMPDFVSLS